MGVKGLTPCYNPVSQVILCCTFMISERKNLMHTRISNPFSKCFLLSKSFFSLFRVALSLLTNVNLPWQLILGPKQPPSHVPQHGSFKLKMNLKITGIFLYKCTPSRKTLGVGRVAEYLGHWPPA